MILSKLCVFFNPYISSHTFIVGICLNLYIYINCTVNMGLTVSEKSVFPASFDRGRCQGNLFSFGKHNWLQKILFDVICLEIRYNGVAFFLTAVDEN